MRRLLWTLAVMLPGCWLAPVLAAGDDREQMKGLDEQVQDVKSDVLGIAAELGRLEEKLLYPSNTQLAVFVDLADGDELRLDAVQVSVDGRLVAHYIYSFKELDALRKGGVQRLWTGNVATGAHTLDVTVVGKLQDGADFQQSGSFGIHKGIEPKLVGVKVAGPGTGADPIQVGDW
jgi:hypothetical protein